MLSSKIRTIPDWPKPWVAFKDITPLLQDPAALQEVAHAFYSRYQNENIDLIVWIESRGFIFGAMLAQMLNVWFIPIRKAGKLPAETEAIEYALEYGTACIEIHKDAVKPGQRVVLIDDLIATGGSCLAACELLQRLWAEIFEIAAVIDLQFLWWSELLEKAGFNHFSLLHY